MKHIIIEGGDRLGKSSLIEGICSHYEYDNVCIRHFGKPPTGMSPEETLRFQIKAFMKEAEFCEAFAKLDEGDLRYYDSVMLWNRSHLGEYVYSQMFRGITEEEIKITLRKFEAMYLDKPYLITLTASPVFFLKQEDGKSFSKDLAQKTKEIELFKEAHEFSTIKKKLLVKVDKDVEFEEGYGYFVFREKQEILNEVLEFINNN